MTSRKKLRKEMQNDFRAKFLATIGTEGSNGMTLGKAIETFGNDWGPINTFVEALTNIKCTGKVQLTKGVSHLLLQIPDVAKLDKGRVYPVVTPMNEHVFSMIDLTNKEKQMKRFSASAPMAVHRLAPSCSLSVALKPVFVDESVVGKSKSTEQPMTFLSDPVIAREPPLATDSAAEQTCQSNTVPIDEPKPTLKHIVILATMNYAPAKKSKNTKVSAACDMCRAQKIYVCYHRPHADQLKTSLIALAKTKTPNFLMFVNVGFVARMINTNWGFLAPFVRLSNMEKELTKNTTEFVKNYILQQIPSLKV